MPDEGHVSRKPRGAECQCVTCGEFFTGESAWQRHLLRVGCQPPGEIRDKHGNPALMIYERSGGPTWGGVGSFDGYGVPSGDAQ